MFLVVKILFLIGNQSKISIKYIVLFKNKITKGVEVGEKDKKELLYFD